MARESKFDAVILGSGPSGQRAAIQCAKLGKSVLVVERDAIGGSCFHTGTIPSKTLREVVGREAEKKFTPAQIFEQAMKCKDRLLVEECAVLSDQLDRNRVQFLQGMAQVDSIHTLRVKTVAGPEQIVRFNHLFLAVGSRPGPTPDWIPQSRRVLDSDQILGITRMPTRLLVVGAGVIGCEYASIFSKMGVKVTLLDRRAKILRGLDADIQERLCQAFKNMGMELCLGADKFQIKEEGNEIELQWDSLKKRFDLVLSCMGRVGLGPALKLEGIGISVNEKGFIEVNSNYQTKVPHIYAVGDVIGSPSLAASGSEQGRLAALHACTGEAAAFSKFFPTGIYTIPEVSIVGKGEDELHSEGIPFVVGRARYAELARGKILGDSDGYLKLMVSKTDRRILGVQILGTSASELVHIGQMGMALGGTLDFFVQNIFNYPTLAEAYKVAALNAHNQLRS